MPNDIRLRRLLFSEAHSSTEGGHSGQKGTIARLSRSFYWPTLSRDIKNWVRSCPICQSVKPTNSKPQGLLQPLPTPVAIWEDLTMDFVTNLPMSAGKTVILVVVDCLCKGAHFIPLRAPFTAPTVATAFLAEVVRLHGVPRSILSDHDPIFLSSFWKTIFRQQGTYLRRSSAYHPQTDGQSEVVNRCLQQYLRCLVMDRPREWTQCLPLAELWYNTTRHSSTGVSPFELTFGRPPPPLVRDAESLLDDQEASAALRHRDDVLRDARYRLE